MRRQRERRNGRRWWILGAVVLVVVAAGFGTAVVVHRNVAATPPAPRKQTVVLTGRSCATDDGGEVLVGAELRNTGPDAMTVYRVVGTASGGDAAHPNPRPLGESLTACGPPATSTTVLTVGGTAWVTTAWAACPAVVTTTVDHLTATAGGTVFLQPLTPACTTPG